MKQMDNTKAFSPGETGSSLTKPDPGSLLSQDYMEAGTPYEPESLLICTPWAGLGRRLLSTQARAL